MIVSLTLVTYPNDDGNAGFSRLSDLAIDLQDQYAQVTVGSIDNNLEDVAEEAEEIQEFFDESTLEKVHVALRRGITKCCDGDGFISDNQVTGVITELQNAGILFREIKH